MRTQRIVRRRGGALFVALVTLMVVMLITMTLVQSIVAVHRQTRMTASQLQAEWLAEAGVARARAQAAMRSDYAGETWKAPFGDGAAEANGVVEIKVSKSAIESDGTSIEVVAHYPDHPLRRATVRREYTLPVPRAVTSPNNTENSP